VIDDHALPVRFSAWNHQLRERDKLTSDESETLERVICVTEMNRRDMLGASALGAAALATGATPARAAAAKPAAGAAASPHLFHLTQADKDQYDGGYLQGANEQTFPILAGQNGAVYFVQLAPGGIREPHWHPSAWELNYIVSGTANWTILGSHPDGSYHQDPFTAGPGDLVFAPTGFFHYFANASTTEPLNVLVVFNSSTPEPNDDLGIVASFNSIPRDILAASFGVPVSAFAAIPDQVVPVVITKAR